MGLPIAGPTYVGHSARSTDHVPLPEAEVLLRRLAECLGHHVNNGLTAVIGYLELSLRDASAKGNHQAHLQAGLASAYQAAEMVKRLAALAAPKVPSSSLSSISLHQLAEEAALKIPKNHGAAYRVQVSGDAPSLAQGDADLLRSALEQIILNAVEAMSPKGTLTLHLEKKNNRCRLHVRDTGPGFSPEATAHLFDPFWTTKRNGHLGLGLVLCRDMLAAQDGNLIVASDAGCGTTVTLSLPVAAPANGDEFATVLAPTSGALLFASSEPKA